MLYCAVGAVGGCVYCAAGLDWLVVSQEMQRRDAEELGYDMIP